MCDGLPGEQSKSKVFILAFKIILNLPGAASDERESKIFGQRTFVDLE
jgi:hypothetical protein